MITFIKAWLARVEERKAAVYVYCKGDYKLFPATCGTYRTLVANEMLSWHEVLNLQMGSVFVTVEGEEDPLNPGQPLDDENTTCTRIVCLLNGTITSIEFLQLLLEINHD